MVNSINTFIDLLEEVNDEEDIKRRFNEYYQGGKVLSVGPDHSLIIKDTIPGRFGGIMLQREFRHVEELPPFNIEKVIGAFRITDSNRLLSLANSPKHVTGDFTARCKTLLSLEGLPKIVEGTIYLQWTPNLPLLRLTSYTDVVLFDNEKCEDVLWDYCKLGNSRKNILACQKALIDAGFEGNAKW